VLPLLGVATAATFALWPALLLFVLFRAGRRFFGRRTPWGFAGPYRSRWYRGWYW